MPVFDILQRKVDLPTHSSFRTFSCDLKPNLQEVQGVHTEYGDYARSDARKCMILCII